MYKILLLAVTAAMVVAEEEPSCGKRIYCQSDLLHRVQLARLFNDSKTFVDLSLRYDEQDILDAFDELLNETNKNPSREQLKKFVDEHFDQSSELEDWRPPDYTENPKFIAGIRDENLRKYGKSLNDLWFILGRKVKPTVLENPDRHSLIPVSNGFIIPGGRFRELYYWDTYWIVEGLLISEMKETAKGIIDNLIQLLKKLGHVPNGSRWYYQKRSQPPLLSAMMALYLRNTGDTEFLKKNIDALEQELNYWLDTQIVTFDKGGDTYTLLRYFAPSEGPRPESYYEDFTSAQNISCTEQKQDLYNEIKSAAESGWDFSSRWFVNKNGDNSGNLSTIHTTDIIPVDLNAIFANALQNMAQFEALLQNSHRGSHWAFLAKQWRSAIEAVFWNNKDGVWYDYDLGTSQHRKYFYPSNVAPLWMGAVDKRLVKKRSAAVLRYLEESHGLDFPGGVPSSLIQSGEQWDFPNAWPPLVDIVVNALEALGTEESKNVAFKVAQTWVRTCYKGFEDSKQMFEKYDAEVPGRYGGGGEYVVQSGFGWSNGVVMEFLAKYGRKLTAHDSTNDDSKSLEDRG